MNKRLQSAMEYLMTYGWAILIIAVVLGALYQLGVFGSAGANLGSSCLSEPGFLCQTPVLNTSGFLAVKLGQIGTSVMTITSVGCSSNSTQPSNTITTNIQLESGATAGVAFYCPLASNAFGSNFNGYLWVTYSTSTQSGIVDRFAVVTAKVATTGGALAAIGLPAAPISKYLYCIGGTAGGSVSNSVYYAPVTSGGIGTWTASTNYPTVEQLGTCAASGGYIYCVTGAASAPTNTIYYSAISSGIGAWSSGAAYPAGITSDYYQSCVTSSSYIYCVGGRTGSATNLVYTAPVSSSGIATWSASTVYPKAIQEESCVSSGGYIYCVGGYDNVALTTSTYYASLSSGTVGAWSATTAYPIAIGLGTCAVSGGYIFCVAGAGSSGKINLDYFAPISSGGIGAWASTTVYPFAVQQQACSTNSGYIYCVGGSTGAGVANTYYAAVSSGGIGSWVSTNSYPLTNYAQSCLINS